MRILSCLFILLCPSLTLAQVFGPIQEATVPIRQNGVGVMGARGDTLWISPVLNRMICSGSDFSDCLEWTIPENADSVLSGPGRLFSIALGSDTVVTGLGQTADLRGESVQTAYGYYFSEDGGTEWRFEPFPLDDDPPASCDQSSTTYNPDCDIRFTYGGQEYTRIRFTVPQQSPPFDIEFVGNTIFSVNWASGLLRSQDFGQTWERLILPPFDQDSLSPNREYEWDSQFQGVTINRYDPRLDNNLLGFGLDIDTDGRVWMGSAGGLNISTNALTADRDEIVWRHIRNENSSTGLLGNWIIDIEQEPGTPNLWMTNWIATAGDRQGVVMTSDGGVTFSQYLIGERINDLGFNNGIIYAAGDNGLFISKDRGQTWIKQGVIRGPNQFIKPSATFQSVATTISAAERWVWIGTSDGIASTNDDGDTWEVTRVNLPLSGTSPYSASEPLVDTYAYPNPFSPLIHEVTRIKFEVTEPGSVQLRIFDFGMNLVRELVDESYPEGVFEVIWDGQDDAGRLVANAPYIYVVEQNSSKVHGKILVIE